ncbi:MAG: hypothetical protein KKA62_00355 [Nanoarchaeota archaeon]|nr:hypothetical protein [Nanoarchaeota archaeon]MBU1643774.1 hypothetical protein [Nanoarchaeota archaeon]MBU1976387.1 hypothetical protein [Nanoarchaeota archaeon]
MSKRGQVTIFIIAGIIILVLILSITYFSRTKVTEELKIEEAGKFKTDPFVSFIDNCLEKSVINGMYLVFSQGGFYEFALKPEVFNQLDGQITSFPPELEFEIFEVESENEILQVPVYFQNKKVNLPLITSIEQEVGKASRSFFLSCVNNFETFKKEGFTVEMGNPDIKITFAERTLVELDYPLKITSGDEVVEIKTFSTIINFNFKEKYEVIKEYLNQQEKDPTDFLMGELSSYAYEKKFDFGFKQFGGSGSEILVDFSYDENLREEPLTYSFALFFNWTGLVEEAEFPEDEIFKLERIPVWNIDKPGIYTYQVKAVGEGLTFRTNPKSLSLDPNTGLITVDTTEFPNDEYLYYVLVNDQFGHESTAPIIININVNTGNLPEIKPIARQTAKIGEEFKFKVEVLNAGKNLFFATDSYLFDIDKETGEISFIPQKEDEGLHSVRVDVENEFGKTWQRWELEIK